MCFRVGAADAEFLAKEFFPTFAEEDLLNLTKYDVYLKLMIDGVASEPFSATTLPPLEGMTNNKDKTIAVSRERYSKAREIVEDRIMRWSGVKETFKGSAEEENKTMPPSYSSKSKSKRTDKPENKPRTDKSSNVKKDNTSKKKEINIGKLQQVEIQQEENTISLNEALKRPPRPFSARKRSSTFDKSKKASSVNNITDHSKNKPKNDSINFEKSSKSLKPGQVINLQ